MGGVAEPARRVDGRHGVGGATRPARRLLLRPASRLRGPPLPCGVARPPRRAPRRPGRAPLRRRGAMAGHVAGEERAAAALRPPLPRLLRRAMSPRRRPGRRGQRRPPAQPLGHDALGRGGRYRRQHFAAGATDTAALDSGGFSSPAFSCSGPWRRDCVPASPACRAPWWIGFVFLRSSLRFVMIDRCTCAGVGSRHPRR